jgi:phage antirepressor YoqD-like protein
MTEDEKDLLVEMNKQLISDKNQLVKLTDLIKRSNEIINQKESIIERQKELIEEKDNQLETWNQIKQSGKWIDMKGVAKILGYKRLGRNTIFGILRDYEVLMSNNEPYQQYVNSGYFKVHLKYVEHLDETICVTMISSKGIDFIRRLLTEEGYV